MTRLGDAAPALWRNGGGVTRELLAWPAPGDWRVRLAVAEVERDGPFSPFPGVWRWFAVLSGAGVRLTVDGKATELTPRDAPFEFAGAAPTRCELLAGTTRDFNLMARSGTARMHRVVHSHAAQGRAASLVAVYSHAGNARVGCAGETLELPPHTLAWRILETDERVEIAGGDALWMEVAP